MFRRVLIANRGEIAVRIIRACRELDIETVAVHSTADAGALHVQLATQSVCVGPPRAAESYLNLSALLTAALETGCDAVHPGYGFLSENPEFADLCAKCDLCFIGPPGDVIRQMGSKAAARTLMRQSGVPVVPGSDGPVADAAQAAAALAAEGFRPDVVIVDPPRKGCAPGLTETIARMNPERVVMVSCDSATAARDAASFNALGYRPVRVQAVDMFPRTANVECVVLMQRLRAD